MEAWEQEPSRPKSSKTSSAGAGSRSKGAYFQGPGHGPEQPRGHGRARARAGARRFTFGDGPRDGRDGRRRGDPAGGLVAPQGRRGLPARGARQGAREARLGRQGGACPPTVWMSHFDGDVSRAVSFNLERNSRPLRFGHTDARSAALPRRASRGDIDALSTTSPTRAPRGDRESNYRWRRCRSRPSRCRTRAKK
jgi:hypothetical protein